MPRKLEINYLYLDLCYDKYSARPSQCDLASWAKISINNARKIIIEFTNTLSLTEILVSWVKISISDARKIIIELTNSISLTEILKSQTWTAFVTTKQFCIWIQPKSYLC